MTREDAIKIIEVVFKDKETYKYYDSVTHQALNMAIEALKAEETIEIKPMEIKGDFHIDDIDKNRRSIFEDIVWVVRCKDCINYETCNLRLSHWWKGGYTVDIEFCSFGERRSNKGEEVNGFKSIGQAWNTSQGRWEK